MKLYKILFFNSMILGTMVAISSYSWFSMWMGLEINLLSIIPLLSTQKNVFSSEASLKYFIVQAMASLILLTSAILMLSLNEFISPSMNFNLMMMLNSALLTKMGAAPFHFWFPEVMEGLNWINCLIMLTWQKIAPMILLMNNSINSKFFTIIIIACLIVSTMMAMNQISMRKIMAFSSINHIGWMMAAMMISPSCWTIYFIVYALINSMIVVMFNYTKTFYMKQINNIMNSNKQIKFFYMMNFLSLGGLPPFIGFLPKWMVINWMMMKGMTLLSVLMIITTLIMLFVYMRVTFSSMILSTNEPKILKMSFNNPLINLINFSLLMSLLACTFLFSLL